jgi:hypothetical protein
MLNVILGILMMSLVSASGIILYEQVALTAVVADQRENARRLDVVADAVSVRLGAPAGANQAVLYAPVDVGQDGAPVLDTVPAGVPGVHATVSGVPFRYCPYAPIAGDSVASGGYLVSGQQSPLPGRPAALVIAAGMHAKSVADVPACSAVTFQNGRYAVGGGLVRAVSAVKGMAIAQLTDGSSFEMWAAPGAAGDGSDSAHPTSLVSAMAIWKGKLPKSMVIHVPGGASFADDGLDAAFSEASQPAGTVRGSKLSIVSDGTTVIAANATFDPQGSLALVGVSMPQTVVRAGSHNAVSFQNARVAGVDVEAGSSAAFNGGVSVLGGGLVVAGDATVLGALEVGVSDPNAVPDVVQVPAGGRVILSNATVTLRGGRSGIALAGDLAGRGAVVGAGLREEIRIVDGGRMALDGSVGGSASGYAILGDGMPSSLGGSLTVGSGAVGCWAGDVFAFSAGSSARPVVPDQVPLPVADKDGKVDPAAVAAFSANSDARSRTIALLGINRSNWACGS